MSIQKQIWERIRRSPRGRPFTVKRFHQLGERAALDQALSRMAKAGRVKRIARGVYVRPELSMVLGELPVPGRKVAEAVAAENRSRLQVSGAEAANRLGLSTQVPGNSIYLTEGPQRTITLGREKVVLKRVTPRRMVGAGTEAGLVLSALRYIGKEGADEDTLLKLRQRLPAEVRGTLNRYASEVPAWMVKPLRYLSKGARP